MSQINAPMRIPWPPILFAGCLSIILGARNLGVEAIVLSPFWLKGVAATIMLVGLGMIGMAVLEFLRGRTAIRPDRGATTLLDAGIFGLSRNPIYEGEALILGGLTLVSPNVPAILALLAFLIGINRLIRLEEAHLAHRFGEAYQHYRTHVPRFMVSWMRFSRR